MNRRFGNLVVSVIAICLMGLGMGCADTIPDGPEDATENEDENHAPDSVDRIDFDGDSDGDVEGDGTYGDQDSDSDGDSSGDSTYGDGDPYGDKDGEGDSTYGDSEGDADGDGSYGDSEGDADGDGSYGDSEGDADGDGSYGDSEGDADGDGSYGDADGDGDHGDDGDCEGGDSDHDGGDGDYDGDGDGDYDGGGDGDGDGPISCYEGGEFNGLDWLDDPLSQGFWKNHSEDWPYGVDSCYAEICGMSFLEILWTPPVFGNAWIILGYQWIAAVLNVDSGVDVCGIDALLEEGLELMLSCQIDDANRDRALEIAGILDDFNNGDMSVGDCDIY